MGVPAKKKNSHAHLPTHTHKEIQAHIRTLLQLIQFMLRKKLCAQIMHANAALAYLSDTQIST